jgi:hypothetical protein
MLDKPSKPLYAPPGPADEVHYETLHGLANLASSLAISAREAAYRGNREELGRYLMATKRAVDNSLKVFDQLGHETFSGLAKP